MTNTAVLLTAIAESGHSIPSLADTIHVNEQTLYNKIQGYQKFTVEEMETLKKELGLNSELTGEIFFS